MTVAPSFTRAQRLAFARRRMVLPLVLFVALGVGYVAMVAAVLAAPLALAFVLTIPCGMLIGLLFVVGHDACHNSFTAATRLNHVIGRLAFLPSLHAFAVWDQTHNRTHHRYNNVRGHDFAWVPMAPETYRDSPLPRRLAYRCFRTPLGVMLYYLLVLWGPRALLPLPRVVGRLTPLYLADTLLVLAFLAVQLWLVVVVGGWFDKSAVTSVLLGVVLPFLVWNAFMSLAIFLHHTHPDIRWYSSVAAWTADLGVMRGTVHVSFTWPIEPLLLAIMQHNAHHFAPGVPLYNLASMQSAMEQHAPCITWRFTWRNYRQVCRACKLYDYEAQRWVGYAAAGA